MNSSLRRQRSGAIVDDHQAPEGSLAHTGSPLPSADFSGLADKNYAIAESVLEAERSNSPSWMKVNSELFESNHGCFPQDTNPGDMSDDDEAASAEPCPLDICLTEVRTMRHHDSWADTLRDLLRISRAVRKTDGYKAEHPLAVVVPNDHNSLDSFKAGDPCYLFARVQFRPYTATLVSMTLEWNQMDQAWLARMLPMAHGLPTIQSMEQFLRMLCEEHDPTKHRLLLVSYETRCFGVLHINGVQPLEEVAGRLLSATAAPNSDDDDAEAKDLKRRSDLLKKVLSAGKPAKEKPVRKAKAQAKNGSKRSRKRRNVTGNDSESAEEGACAEEPKTVANDEEPGIAGETDKAIEGAWGDALEAELPQFSAPASSSTSASTSKTGATSSQPGPQLSRPPGPWKDDNGYCFMAKEGKPYGLYLGTGLRFIESRFVSFEVSFLLPANAMFNQSILSHSDIVRVSCFCLCWVSRVSKRVSCWDTSFNSVSVTVNC